MKIWRSTPKRIQAWKWFYLGSDWSAWQGAAERQRNWDSGQAWPYCVRITVNQQQRAATEPLVILFGKHDAGYENIGTQPTRQGSVNRVLAMP